VNAQELKTGLSTLLDFQVIVALAGQDWQDGFDRRRALLAGVVICEVLERFQEIGDAFCLHL
jgi:hypothetical protein